MKDDEMLAKIAEAARQERASNHDATWEALCEGQEGVDVEADADLVSEAQRVGLLEPMSDTACDSITDTLLDTLDEPDEPAPKPETATILPFPKRIVSGVARHGSGEHTRFSSGDFTFEPFESCTQSSTDISAGCEVYKNKVCDVVGPHASNVDGIQTKINMGEHLGFINRGWLASYWDQESNRWREWTPGSPPKANALDKAWQQPFTTWYHAQEWGDIDDWNYPATNNGYGCTPVTRYGWWDDGRLRIVEVHHCVTIC